MICSFEFYAKNNIDLSTLFGERLERWLYEEGTVTVAESGWIDISVPLKNGMLGYPDDPAVRVVTEQDVEKGDVFTLTAISMSAHSGTHVDSPRHFIAGGPTIDSLPFAAVNGPARVIAIDDPVSVTVAELERHRVEPGEIILFKTRNSAFWISDIFREDHVYLSTEAAVFLAGKKIRSVGIDYLSVGGFQKNEADVHRVLLEVPVWIIESLDLSKVEPGHYDLFCLPLRIEGCEAAPARAFVKAVQSGR
jgi:arylformamidase